MANIDLSQYGITGTTEIEMCIRDSVTMLEKQGILTKEEKDQIIEGLESICRDVENKTLCLLYTSIR